MSHSNEGTSSSDSVTTTSTQSYGGQIKGAFIGALIGLALIIGGPCLLWWNEGQIVAAFQALDVIREQVQTVSPETLSPAHEGKLVHVIGQLTTRTPAQDQLFKITSPDMVLLNRKVEMYQWEQSSHSTSKTETIGGTKTTTTTYSYKKTWSEKGIDSSSFQQKEGHENPAMTLASATYSGQTPKIGTYGIQTDFLGGLPVEQEILIPETSAVQGFRSIQGSYYKGQSELNPEIGDMRVTFKGITAQPASIIGQLQHNTIMSYHGKRGVSMKLIGLGEQSSEDLIQKEEQGQLIQAWIFRTVGFVLLLIGSFMVLNPIGRVLGFFQPLAWIADFATGAFAVVFSLSVGTLTIAASWFVFKPLWAVALVALLGALIYGIKALRRPKNLNVMQAASEKTKDPFAHT